MFMKLCTTNIAYLNCLPHRMHDLEMECDLETECWEHFDLVVPSQFDSDQFVFDVTLNVAISLISHHVGSKLGVLVFAF